MKKNILFVALSWLWLLLVFIASLIPNPKSTVRQLLKKFLRIIGKSDTDKHVHFIFYFLLVFLFVMAYKNTKIRGLIFFGVIIFSGFIELIQPRLTHGHRKCDINDFMYNVLGCISALILAVTLEFLINSFNESIKPSIKF